MSDGHRPLTEREAEEVQARFEREVLYGNGTGQPRGIVTDPLPATGHPTTRWIKPPAFRPDPELIDHLEGNERTIRRYRRAAQRQIGEAMTTTGCAVCGGYGMRHDPIAHGAEPTWIDCRTCNGDGSIRDTADLDVTCPDCDGDGG